MHSNKFWFKNSLYHSHYYMTLFYLIFKSYSLLVIHSIIFFYLWSSWTRSMNGIQPMSRTIIKMTGFFGSSNIYTMLDYPLYVIVLIVVTLRKGNSWERGDRKRSGSGRRSHGQSSVTSPRTSWIISYNIPLLLILGIKRYVQS